MKIIKNKDNYSITLSKDEAENLIDLVDVYPLAWSLIQIRHGLLKAKLEGKSDSPLTNEFCIPPQSND